MTQADREAPTRAGLVSGSAPAGLEREAADPYVLSPAQAAALLRGAPWRRLAVVGDSIAEGVREDVPGYGPDSWGERLASALRRERPDLEYLNLGKRGLRVAEVRSRQLEPALRFRPDLAIVVCGGNDLLARCFDGDALEAEIEAIVAALVGTGADVVTFTMFGMPRALEIPPEFGDRLKERLDEVHARWRAVSRRHGTLLVDFARHPVSADPGIYSTDFQHANTRGHAIVASETIRHLGERLASH
jgi:lysophospholipase L1-like esterase